MRLGRREGAYSALSIDPSSLLLGKDAADGAPGTWVGRTLAAGAAYPTGAVAAGAAYPTDVVAAGAAVALPSPVKCEMQG